MALLEWNNLFNTNIEIVDEQHMELVAILNSLHDLVLKDDNNFELGILLEKLVEYTVFHFETEENLFEKYDYPEAEEHKNEHIDLANQAKKILQDYKSGSIVISSYVTNFLKDWLKNHIIHTDKKFGFYVKHNLI